MYRLFIKIIGYILRYEVLLKKIIEGDFERFIRKGRSRAEFNTQIRKDTRIELR